MLGHFSRVSLVQSSGCAPLVNGEDYKRNEAKLKHCRSWLGPNQPGVTTPDPTAERGQPAQPPASGEDEPRVSSDGAGAGVGEATQVLDFLLAP
jgi:hypothetical protein